MRCSDCKRVLLRAALEIPTKNGPLLFGPICAKRYIVKPTRSIWPRLEKLPAAKARPADPAQLVLELETVDG